MRSDLVKGFLTTTLMTTLGAGLVAGVFIARPAIAQDNMPEGPGKAETVAACSGCHGLGQITGEHRSAEDWATTVTAMINNGAPVADADFDKVVNYLATNFGTGAAPAAGATPAAPGAAPAAPGVTPAAPAESGATPAAPGMAPAEPGAAPATPGVPPATPGVTPAPGTVPATPAAPAGSAAATPSDGMPEGPGKAETVAACSGCHGVGQIIGEHRSAEDWATTVTAMINNGAPVADADFDKVVNYLATNFGTGAAPAAPAPAQ